MNIISRMFKYSNQIEFARLLGYLQKIWLAQIVVDSVYFAGLLEKIQ